MRLILAVLPILALTTVSATTAEEVDIWKFVLEHGHCSDMESRAEWVNTRPLQKTALIDSLRTKANCDEKLYTVSVGIPANLEGSHLNAAVEFHEIAFMEGICGNRVFLKVIDLGQWSIALELLHQDEVLQEPIVIEKLEDC